MGGDAADDSGAAATGAAGDGGEPQATINIRCSNGTKFSVQAAVGSTIGEFKETVAATCDVPANQQRLIYKGRILKDDQTLESYGLESDHTIHLVRGAAPSAVNPPTGTNLGASKVPNSSQTERGAGGLGSVEGGDLGHAGSGITPFPALGPSGLFGAGFPEFEQVQQQLTQNPNMMSEMMNMPVIQNLMNNPDLMRNLIMSNPHMREIIDRNPELGHILNDPSTLRQTLEAARNPELMREMMRNTDRAMSNIESSPEGFNMLRRMYETVQEPFLNATTMAGDTRNDSGSNPFSALLGNQGAAQVRDQTANPLTTGSETTGSPAPNSNPLPNPWSNAPGGQTNNTRPSPASGARAPSIAGLGGLGLPGLGHGMQDSSLFNEVLQNPAMTQMMQSLMSNPQYMNQILSLNPETRNLMDSNPQFREMLRNPEFLQQLASPETLRQVRALQQSLQSLSPQPAGQEPNPTGGIAGTGNTGAPNSMGLDLLMNMFGGLGVGGFGVPVTSNVPPEELYATQLSQLQEMGFFDTQENIRALSATAGNVHAAVERLLGNLGQ